MPPARKLLMQWFKPMTQAIQEEQRKVWAGCICFFLLFTVFEDHKACNVHWRTYVQKSHKQQCC